LTPAPTITPTPTVPTPTHPTTSQPTPQPADIFIVSHRGYVDSSGTFWVFGEVENSGGQNLQFVEINARLYGKDNTLIAYMSTFIPIDIILPGERSPFSILKVNPPSVDHYEVKISHYIVTDIAPYRGFETLSSSSSVNAAGEFEVVGEMQNVGTKAVKYTQVLATFYDEEGNVVVTTWAFVKEATLNPGDKGTFIVKVVYKDLVPSIYTYALTIEGAPQ